MKRRLLYGALALLIITCLGVTLGLGWLLQTPAGVRWLLRAVSQNSAVQVSAKTVSGGLASAVQIKELTARWPAGELAVADLRLRGNPLLLPFGTLAIKELTLHGVRLRDHSLPRAAEPEFIWPRVTGLPTFFAARINHLSITDVSYQDRKQLPVMLPNFTATMGWHDARLIITNLSLIASGGQLTGAITAGFGSPALDSDLSFTPQQPVAGCNRFKLQTLFKPGLAAEQLAGEVNATAMTGKSMRYTLNGIMGLSRNSLNLHGVTLTEHGRNGSLKAEGNIALSGESRLQLQLNMLDLTKELGQETALSGTVALNGDTRQYAGKLNLATSGAGWRTGRINGDFRGDKNGIELTRVNAALLGGTADGTIRVDWQDVVTVQSSLHGHGLNPAHLDPAWNGTVNFDLQGSATWAGGSLNQAKAYGRLRESRLRGKVLRGEIAAQLKNDDLQVDRLLLTGNGFDLQAAGRLSQRLDLTANISDLSGLIPQTRGKLALKGWGCYAAGIASGQLSGQGSNLVADGLQITSATLNAGLIAGADRSLQGKAELHGLQFQGMKVDNASLQAEGLLAQHRLTIALGSAGATISGQVNGGYVAGQWQGELTELSGHDLVGPWRLTAPARLAISAQAATISPLAVTGLPGEHAELAAKLQLKPFKVAAQAGWHELNLARIEQWLLATRLTGQSSGEVTLELFDTNQLIVRGNAIGAGTITRANRTIGLNKAHLNLDAGQSGTKATLELSSGGGTSFAGRFISAEPAILALPTQGELQASWSGIDATLVKRWLPQNLDLPGRLSGQLTGSLLPAQRFELSGTIGLAGGELQWDHNGQQLKAAVKTAGLTWTWRGDSLSGDLALQLARFGEAKGSFKLPLKARLGALPDPAGPVKGKFQGKFQEQGILTSIFPGLLQETKGLLEVNLTAAGTWQKPAVYGTMELSRAGAYLPAAGIWLEDLRLAARLDGTQLQVESFQLTSGTGMMEGTAEFSFAGKKLAGYHGTLHGKRFQAIHLPELQLVVDPDLTFTGDLNRVSARGQINVPELRLNSQAAVRVIMPSSDIVVLNKKLPAAKTRGPQLDLQLSILLGDQVVVKNEGLDARLVGSINLQQTAPAAFTGRGEIRVAKGNYRIYGVNLNIKRGRAIFSGGPVDRPTLDILALREIVEVKAGVTVTGTPDAPLIKLYSEPTLPDTDILSYLVLGQKMGESGQQTALLMQAASLLGSSNQTTDLQGQLKKLVGLDTIKISSGKEPNVGYKPIESSLRANPQSKTDSKAISQSMLQLGKYLTPKLYVSYGRSLFDESQQLRARYAISKQWEIESKVSQQATGGDLFFRIDLE